MITQTFTYTLFQFNDTGFDYSKKLGGELDVFNETALNTDLEDYLKRLLVHKKRLDTEGVANIAIYHTVFYDNQCNTEFSPKIAQLLSELGAIFCISAQRNYDGETLYQVLDRLREHPAMYFGEHSLSALYHFTAGFFTACNGGTQEEPAFSGFNDFVAAYYGKTAVAGWRNNILADHWGNEHEALDRFFELLDKYREAPNRPNARDIVHRILYLAFLQFRGEAAEIAQNTEGGVSESALLKTLQNTHQIAHLLHNIPLQIKNADSLFEYELVLQDIFDRARGNKYLHHLLKNNNPELAYFEYELWHGRKENGMFVTTLIPSHHAQKDSVLDACEVLIETLFAINDEKIRVIKEDFIENFDKAI